MDAVGVIVQEGVPVVVAVVEVVRVGLLDTLVVAVWLADCVGLCVPDTVGLAEIDREGV